VLRGWRLIALVAVGVAAAVLLALALTGGGGSSAYGPVTVDPGKPDPFAYEPGREDEFVSRATAGHSQVLYEKSPGGVIETARRVERWRPQVEQVARRAGVDPDVLEAIVFLESAGLPDARASDDLRGAVGLTQILASTATDLLGLHVDLAAAQRLTRRIDRAGTPAKAKRLEARRRQVDERFDPAKALAATGRYLQQAKARFGRDDLAVVSYHMGIGNLDNVLNAYGEHDVSWAQVYFDSTPRHRRAAYLLLSGFGDDSATYLWRVYAAREIMRLYRHDRTKLGRLDELQQVGADSLRPLEGIPGIRLSPQLQATSHDVQPAAFDLAVYLAAGVRQLSGVRAPLTVSGVSDWSLDIRRRYANGAQALAFQYMLDRLQSLDLIAWTREADVIHLTASSECARLVQ
jgi:soluble lytic murein transglycosylase-like protein